ncbi:Fibrinogen-like protein 1,Tenascin,Angiopoietin-related protein 6,Angiopoietin-related protein 7,Ficolin-2,Ryncolin-1,Tenascin-R,Ficolin-1,Fibrinogen C domain-containing protein 1 [Mytilus coruscus]|uniref:Fibrinogen-like protein 1,Tenascin,Angiopoietin-related protein 6,Angiopoietin-related protein 7,Ficolin-2,Ryncolin-1,Tenascin-R,Ficolin-1,Fibrinogen C domain-containing protein 1 n=1 Tax=Mytilus coruscus TaxID=42192 RepID=A0A6J8EWY3_MYTCO|nr:Fibrinogen-like protein 1,Tenascin,Angiopoietin-related protein 6,Angiopoietin-related protein 7,Ficolin-2,Ryncolin-1,Tenascin-R,Ficolin-1,Fibrinogen C domain-containing protein 1 [Mytilus coruscus]
MRYLKQLGLDCKISRKFKFSINLISLYFIYDAEKTHDSYCGSSDECLGTLFCIHGKCKCDRTDYWSGSVCLPKKSINSTCNTNEQCDNKYRCIDNVCTCTQAEYLNGEQCLSKRLECEDVKDTRDGVYIIHPGGGDSAVFVYCIMEQAQKWTVIQRRANGSVDFYRTWQEYKNGFGSVYGEYWLGNDNIHMISTNGHHELSIYMQAETDHRMANYSTFSVGDESSKYRLAVTGYSGDAGSDSMDKVDDNKKANRQPFTTRDRDNDNHVGNCAVESKSAWWYRNCFSSDFNRAYSGSSGRMYWAWFSGNIGKSILMIRRTS